ncbi:DNA-3-methyladenine glycosylase family protein [Muricoccus nepalensis]|nr:DNA-3-methyladenine glycosylase 2 family protein [Roseomonas nepalensis]
MPGTPPAAVAPAALAGEPPAWAATGLAALALADPLLHGVLATAGPLLWRRRAPGFPGLLRAICGQQISNHAAGAIWARLRALPGALDPRGLLALDDAALCGAAGLSRPKAAHARSLAAAILEGRLRLHDLPAMTDAEAVAHLSETRGLGRWTAQVHLLFAEDRPDLFPEGDLALAASLAHLRGLPARPAPRALAALAEDWAPWRSLAARLLWHHWRHATGRPGKDPEDDG